MEGEDGVATSLADKVLILIVEFGDVSPRLRCFDKSTS